MGEALIQMSNKSLRRQLIGLVALSIALLVHPMAALAHPIDEYLQSAYIELASNHVTVEINLTPGVLVAPGVMQLIDTDGDGTFSHSEGQTYATRVLHDVSLALDGQIVQMSVNDVQMPDPLIMKAGGGEIRVTMAAVVSPKVAISHRLVFTNSHAPVKSAHQVSTLKPDANQFVIIDQKRSATSDSIAIDYQLAQSASVTVAAPTVTATASNISTQQNQLMGYLRQTTLTPSVIALALVLAILLGGMHALTPGHGKTLVAAYLVGSRGTAKHAVLLGLVVTVTHTASVILIGMLALLASHFVLPSVLVPILELSSGVLVVVLGARLLWVRWHMQHTVGEQTLHDHGFGSHTHLGATPVGVTRGGILAMGVSGGLVPCPEALGVLLVAVGLGRFALGLGLIVMFSLGLAVVLIGLGILIVQARPLLRRFESAQSAWQHRLPLIGAMAVTALGCVLVVKGMIAYGF